MSPWCELNTDIAQSAAHRACLAERTHHAVSCNLPSCNLPTPRAAAALLRGPLPRHGRNDTERYGRLASACVEDLGHAHLQLRVKPGRRVKPGWVDILEPLVVEPAAATAAADPEQLVRKGR